MREMKDSGIEWIGEIPKDWKTCKLLYCLRQSICDGPHETPKFIEQGIPFISVDSLNDTKEVNLDIVKRFISEGDYNNYMTKARLENGDILFSKSATIGKTAIVGKEKFMIWSPLAVLKNSPKICNRDYLYYLLNCEHLITSIRLSGSYNTQANVGMRQIEKAQITLPRLETQDKITSYLDSKCSKIDDIIEKQQSVIEKLKAYKQSIITEAVTKGLNPDVPMKDSGVEWIGEVPEHWKVKKLKYVGKFVNGYAFPSNAFKNSGTLVMKISNIQPMKIIWDEKSFVDKKYEDLTSYCVHKGDLVFALTRPIINGGIKTAIANNHETVLLNQRNAMFKGNREISTKWQYYLMQSKMFIQEFALYIDGTGQQPNISTNEISNIKVMLPDLKEQKQIADYLDQKCSAIDSTIANKQALIEKLTAYKKSLIYEVVTGKKEV